MDTNLIDRATELGTKAITALPPTIGYVGVDLILTEDSTADSVIEVNPRLTTSYIGLREIAETNLAEVMLSIATGSELAVSFSNSDINFNADGTLN